MLLHPTNDTSPYLNAGGVAVLVDVVDATGVEGGRTTDDAVDLECWRKVIINNWDIANSNRHFVSNKSTICAKLTGAVAATVPPTHANTLREDHVQSEGHRAQK